MKNIAATAAIAKINAALAGGCEPEWKPQVEAIISYMNGGDDVNPLWSSIDLICMVKEKTGVNIDTDLAMAIIDIITE